MIEGDGMELDEIVAAVIPSRVPRSGTPWVAVGETYGNEPTKTVTARRGRTMGLEQVPFVEFYSGLQKQFPVLLLERGLAAMFSLSLEVHRSTPFGVDAGGWRVFRRLKPTATHGLALSGKPRRDTLPPYYFAS